MTAAPYDQRLLAHMQAQSEFDSAKIQAAPAYLFWFFLGAFGAHRFYLRRTGTAVAILLTYLISLPLMFLGIGLITIWIPVIWVFVDLFLIPGIVQEENAMLRSRIFQRHGLGPVPPQPYQQPYPPQHVAPIQPMAYPAGPRPGLPPLALPPGTPQHPQLPQQHPAQQQHPQQRHPHQGMT